MLPDTLKALRKEMKKTQAEIANMLGITRQGYAKYENDLGEPDNATLTKLADYYGVSTDYLLGRTDNSELINNKNIDNKKTGFSSIDTSSLSEYQIAVLEWAFNRENAHFSKKKEDVLEMLEMFEVMYEKMKDK
jgi:transcriptional regulator with XRE-family HTH domain